MHCISVFTTFPNLYVFQQDFRLTVEVWNMENLFINHTPGGTVNGEWKENNRRDLMNYVSNLETFA
jgi:hypothetical protein